MILEEENPIDQSRPNIEITTQKRGKLDKFLNLFLADNDLSSSSSDCPTDNEILGNDVDISTSPSNGGMMAVDSPPDQIETLLINDTIDEDDPDPDQGGAAEDSTSDVCTTIDTTTNLNHYNYIVRTSEPKWMIKLVINHYCKILLIFIMIYGLSLALCVGFELFKLDQISKFDLLLPNEKSTF